MMIIAGKWVALFVLLTTAVGFAQHVRIATMTQRKACAQFSSAVVRIEAGGQSRGTGFIVSPDGYILTASHVVRDDTDGSYFSTIAIRSPAISGFAKPAISIGADNVGQDFALLKIETSTHLPFLQLGNVSDAVNGSDATIIGFPFSALTMESKNVFTKFCLSAEFAATDIVTVPVRETQKTASGTVPSNRDVKVNVIYFQGPSVKGISGSPIISRDTGTVVGIVSIKLTGIGQSLMELKAQTAQGLGSGIAISGLQPGPVINQILTVLDDQLANNLGAAAGIDDPKYALAREQRKAGRK